MTVLFGGGDPMRAGAPFGLIMPLLRGACGIQDGDGEEDRRRKVLSRMQRHMQPERAMRVAEFFGEVIGARFDDATSTQLRSARRDSRLMGDQIRRSWEDWLAAECAAGPVVVVLEAPALG